MAFQTSEVSRPLGVNIDQSPYDVPPEVWTFMLNGDSVSGKSSRVPGVAVYHSGLTIQPLHVQSWNDGTEDVWVYADEDSIYKINAAGTETKMGPTVGTYAATFDIGWTSTILNGVLIMNNQIDVPQYADTPTTMADLANWDATKKCRVMRSHKNFLIALGIDDVGGDRPSEVLWSSPADIGSVPPSWDVTDPAEQAGSYELADTPGRIVDGKNLGDSFIIYKEDSVWAMDFIGGNFTFRFRQIFDDKAGAIATGCVGEFEGKHFVLTANDAYVHDGVSKKSVMDSRVRTALTNVDPEFIDKTRVIPDYSRKEMLIHFVGPSATDELSNTIVAWNWEYDAWSYRQVEGISAASSGFIEAVTGVSNVWDDAVGVWNDNNQIWNEGVENAAKTGIILADYTNSRLLELNRGSTYAGANYITLFQHRGIDFGNRSNVVRLNAIYPYIEGTVGESVFIRVGYEMNPQEGIRWDGPYEFVIGQDEKVTCRVTGRLHSIEFYSTSGPPWSLSGYTAEWADTRGKR